jgi:hypothetical protein
MGVAAMAAVAGFGCGGKSTSYSILQSQDVFNQNASTVQGNIDVLWVVDNSGSMRSSQENVRDNFSRFISNFQAKGFNYKLAVTTTDAYKDQFGYPASQSLFRDGTNATSHTGVFVVTPATVNPVNTFLVNVIQGTSGSGDERAFQSIQSTFQNPGNAGFIRSNGFLAVVIVSDEEDFSHDGSIMQDSSSSNPILHTTDRYVSYLDGLTSSTSQNRNYSVNAITIMDNDSACLASLNATSSGRKYGKRYQELAAKTQGVVGSLCGDFGNTLENISNRIAELSTRFTLSRLPKVSTIQAFINGVAIPMNAANGWTYESENNSVVFHGAAIPPASAQVSVKFDPATLL